MTQEEVELNPVAAMLGYPGLYWWQTVEDLPGNGEVDAAAEPSSLWEQFGIATGFVTREYLAAEAAKARAAEQETLRQQAEDAEPPPQESSSVSSAQQDKPAPATEVPSSETNAKQQQEQQQPPASSASKTPPRPARSTTKRPKVSPNEFRLHRPLGQGKFGEVVLATHAVSDKLVALKCLHKKLLANAKSRERARNEFKINAAFARLGSHPFVVGMTHAFQTEECLCLALELLPCGELFQLTSNRTGAGSYAGKVHGRRFPEKAARFYVAECVLAVEFVHSRKVLYRDLKPENVLINADGHVKISDFGLSKPDVDDPFKGATSMCGTPEYIAPEILTGTHEHGLAVDWWALGALLFELLDGHPPWYARDRNKLFEKIAKTSLKMPRAVKPKLSNDAVALLKSLLEKDATRRLGSTATGPTDVKAHRFFAMVDFDALFEKKIDPPFRPKRVAPAKANGDAMTWKDLKPPDVDHPVNIDKVQFANIFRNWDYVAPGER